ncbi:hypothetical protein Celaphus_00012072 [Cervus elaphus hippelaphus]|uniref:Uncharacterized protein n=1 Tax=Cervus elaphus hippelaphus TaxID=46360 RepID=A0A212CKI4_CEREH|nr:hypothetical protein Celaphus_00012072 [Cervus elaphus hippelaphus]
MGSRKAGTVMKKGKEQKPEEGRREIQRGSRLFMKMENTGFMVEGRISGLEWLGTHPVTLCGDELMAPPLITRGDGGALGLRDKSGPAPEPALPQKCPKPACLFHEGPAGERLGPSALLCSPSQLSCDCQGRLVGPLLPFLCIPP